MDPRLEALDALTHELETLLGALEVQGDGGDAGMQGAWSRCQRAFDAYRECQSAHADEALPEQVRVKLDDALRLQAVAVSCAQRSKLQVQQEIAALGEARGKLKSALREGAVARSCDVQG